MSFSVFAIPNFERELKALAKKYISLKTEYIDFVKSIKENPIQGDNIGNNCYKIRLAIASKGKGERGGARIIIHVKIIESEVFLLSIYDKSDKESISNNELLQFLRQI